MSLEIIISYNSSGPSSNYVNVFDMNMGVFQFDFVELFSNYASYFWIVLNVLAIFILRTYEV